MGSDSSSRNSRVLSIHWGFTIGGGGKYAATINAVSRCAPIDMETICILCPAWHCDRETLAKLSPKKIVIRSRSDVSWIWRVSREIDRINPDLIMTHGFNGHFVVMATALLRRKRIRMICSYHGLYHAPSSGRRVFEKFFNAMTEYFIRRRALGVVSVTEYSKKYLVRKGVNPHKITVIHNGIDSSSVVSEKTGHELRREWGVQDDEILLGVASRLDPVKGISHLVDAFAMLLTRANTLKLVIVGTGTLDKSLKEKVHKLGLSSRIVFAGFRSDVDGCLSAFDIFILPSLAEYHSIALLEAMRARKPIIATDVGGNTESVRHEREALIVPPADALLLAEAIERLSNDEVLRTRLADSANRRFLQHFTTGTMIRRTADWILRCAGFPSSQN